MFRTLQVETIQGVNGLCGRKENKRNGWWERGEHNTRLKNESERKEKNTQEGGCKSGKGFNENGN